MLADYIENGLLDHLDINEILTEENCSVKYETNGFEGNVRVIIQSIDEIRENNDHNNHPNIRLLVNRMENSLSNKDYSGVLHASASIFETLAKKIVDKPSVQNQSLGSFFEAYKKGSKLPKEILTYINEVYKSRSKEPLAGHGSLNAPTLLKEDAIILYELTKAIIKIERKISVKERE